MDRQAINSASGPIHWIGKGIKNSKTSSGWSYLCDTVVRSEDVPALFARRGIFVWASIVSDSLETADLLPDVTFVWIDGGCGTLYSKCTIPVYLIQLKAKNNLLIKVIARHDMITLFVHYNQQDQMKVIAVSPYREPKSVGAVWACLVITAAVRWLSLICETDFLLEFHRTWGFVK